MNKKTPFVYWDLAEVDSGIIPFPYLGATIQPGWELSRTVQLTDGNVHSIEGLRKVAKMVTAGKDTYGFGILYADLSVVTIGVYLKLTSRPPKIEVDFLDPDDEPAKPFHA